MKLLFDQNLSPRLVKLLKDVYPDASHVYLVHLDQATDIAVWEYVQQHGCAIVTRDVDFIELGMLRIFLQRSFGCVVEIALPRILRQCYGCMRAL